MTDRLARLARAASGVAALRAAALKSEAEFAAEIDAAAASMRESARNLVHYLAVRRHDIRALQEDLTRLGLSSLGSMESHVMASLDAVGEALEAMRPEPHEAPALPASDFDSGPERLLRHANEILGAPRKHLATRIMVTAPPEAADDPGLVRDLLEAGMSILRINCAHDGPEQWERMVRHLRHAEHETGKHCRVEFDLAGPKLRTGPMAPGPAVARWRPRRDALGRVIERARIRFVAADRAAALPGAIPVTPELVREARVNDHLDFIDARGRKRSAVVIERSAGEMVCEADNTAYVVPGMALALRRRHLIVIDGVVGDLPRRELSIALRVGDRLRVVRGERPGSDRVIDRSGRMLAPPVVSCAVPQVFENVSPGDPILFDDGLLRGVIRDVHADRLEVEITQVMRGGARLKPEKGINLPDSDLALPAITAEDQRDLDFVAVHGDMVAISFVQRPEDIATLIDALSARDASRLGLVLKIETRAAFERLPALLLAAMRDPPVAVMAARGDLGIEVGFERLSEVQEEILWLCEAAHVPVIWATQVLESLAKGGMPSRAEITDAAMGSRAECVMLNKGPYIREALDFLVDVLRRMEEHQHKKTARLRKLRVSEPRRRALSAAERA